MCRCCSSFHLLPSCDSFVEADHHEWVPAAIFARWIYAITKNPTIGRIAENVYHFWARNRMAVTGRPELEVMMICCCSIAASSSCTLTGFIMDGELFHPYSLILSF